MYISVKKNINEQFGRKMNQDVGVNRKLFWKEERQMDGGKGGEL